VGRRRVQDGRGLGQARDPERLVGRPGPDLVADEDHIAAFEADALELAPDLDRVERGVRPTGDGDRVLARLIDHDQGDARGLVRKRQQPGDIDPLGLERGARRRPERVVADGPDEHRLGTEPGGRDGLVAALAALVLGEPAADDGLARPRQVLRRDDKVHVDGADDDDPPGHPTIP
jgi:hypothetical protein